ncbi:hypothetical protein Avbf_17832, partial [Armadillidium vulgare]
FEYNVSRLDEGKLLSIRNLSTLTPSEGHPRRGSSPPSFLLFSPCWSPSPTQDPNHNQDI